MIIGFYFTVILDRNIRILFRIFGCHAGRQGLLTPVQERYPFITLQSDLEDNEDASLVHSSSY